MHKNRLIIISLFLFLIFSCSNTQKIQTPLKNSKTAILFISSNESEAKNWNPFFEKIKNNGQSLTSYFPCQNCTFEEAKKEVTQVYHSINSSTHAQNIIIIGHGEGTLLAAELSFSKFDDPSLKKIILLSVIAQNYKEIIHAQMTTQMARDLFSESDLNKDGKISQVELPEKLKNVAALNENFTQGDLLRLLEKQYQGFLKLVEKNNEQSFILGRPVLWFRELFNSPSLISKASSFTRPVTLIHTKFDNVAPFYANAFTFYNKLRSLKKETELFTIKNDEKLYSNEEALALIFKKMVL